MSRTLLTGLSVITANGPNTEDFWSHTLTGVSGLGEITRFDASDYPLRVAGEINDLDPADFLSSRLLAQTDHMTQLALVASDRALADADVSPDELPDFSAGVVTASASGGFEFGQRELEKLWSKGSSHVSAYQSFAWFYAVNTGQISIRHGLRGPSGVLVAEQAGGLDAIAQARRVVRNGTSLVVTGGVDSSLCPWGVTAQIPGGRLSTSDDATLAYLPFDTDASGHVPGEGGALLIVEDSDAARDRGHPQAYGEIAGWAASFDPPEEITNCEGIMAAVEGALADARTNPEDIDVVLADASGVPALDRAEAEALSNIFGPGRVPVTAPKSMIGRLYSGGGPVDVASAALSIRDGVIPPTIGTRKVPKDCELDIVLAVPRPAEVNTVLVIARGYGGFNSALVLRRAA